MHKYNGAPKYHMNSSHGAPVTRELMEGSTKILRFENDQYRLMVMGALLIYLRKPSLNEQATGINRTIKLYSTQRDAYSNDLQRGISSQRSDATPGKLPCTPIAS